MTDRAAGCFGPPGEGLSWRRYGRVALLGALGAAGMLTGDLCLSVIPAGAGDSGLFAREAYLSGSYPPWRLTLLLGTGLEGMALCAFAVWVCWVQILPRHIWLRRGAAAGGVIYLTSAGVLHFHIGSLADWTSTLAPLLGREETAALIAEKYARLAPALTFSYGGMFLLMLVSFWAAAAKKTVLPRWMLIFHLIPVQLALMLIPDVRQALGAAVSTWDFVLSQGSGNAGLLCWMLANALWARRQEKREVTHHEC